MRTQSIIACGIAAMILLSGCTSTGGNETATGTPSPGHTSVPEPTAPATIIPTIPYGADDVEGDVLACQNVNSSANFMLDLAAANTKYNSTQDVFEQFYGAGMGLLYSADGVEMTPAVGAALNELVFVFTDAPRTTEDGVSGYWNVAKAHTEDPESSELAPKLTQAAEACGAVGYSWVRWVAAG